MEFCKWLHRHRQGRRDKISVISGISVSPKRHRLGLYYLLFYDSIGQDEVCLFLRELLRQRHTQSGICRNQSSLVEVDKRVAGSGCCPKEESEGNTGAEYGYRKEGRQESKTFMREGFEICCQFAAKREERGLAK